MREQTREPVISEGVRLMAAGAFFFGVMSLLVKLAGQRLPSQEIVLARAVVTLALSAWGVRDAGVSFLGHARRLLLLRGVLGYTALSCFYYAVVHLPLADATVIQYTNPVFASVLAVWALRERLHARELALVAASLAGVVLVARPTFLFGAGAGGLPVVPAAVGLAGAVASAAAYVAVRKLGATDQPAVIIFYFSAVSVLGSLPLALPAWVWPTPGEWALLLAVGVATQAGQLAFTRGLRRERAGRATAVGYLQVVFAAGLGIAFLGEVPDAGTVLGGAAILASLLALARQRPAA